MLTFAAIFFLSRIHWIIALHYHSSPYATASIFVSLLVACLALMASYVIGALVPERVFALIARAAVIAMLLFLVAVLFHNVVYPSSVISLPWQALLSIGAVALAIAGAITFRAFWPRLRAALLVATTIGTCSGPVLAALMGRPVELLADSGQRHQPVVILLLDEFSAGSAEGIVEALKGRGLAVDFSSVPSIGKDTIDVIPGIFTRSAIDGARACTSTAICGHGAVVDFARMHVQRPDVDIVGIYHRYCVIQGLRWCANPESSVSAPVVTWFLCALPLRSLLGGQLGCSRAGYVAPGEAPSSAAEDVLFRAPFWDQGGFLYAHLRLPHPPSATGELRLADAYAANVERAGKLVMHVIDRLDASWFRDSYTLIVVSDHHLRADYWCKQEPYATNGCELPPAMRTDEVPFIIASRRTDFRYDSPRSNADLLKIASELSDAH